MVNYLSGSNNIIKERLIMSMVISSEAPSGERSETISKESTAQAGGKRQAPHWGEEIELHGNVQQYLKLSKGTGKLYKADAGSGPWGGVMGMGN